MRTNSIDATAFRCLAEYKTLVDICIKLYDDDDLERPSVKAVDNYLDELMGVDTAKEVRDLHKDKLNFIIKKINAVIDLTYETQPKKENVVIEPNNNIRYTLKARPRNIND